MKQIEREEIKEQLFDFDRGGKRDENESGER